MARDNGDGEAVILDERPVFLRSHLYGLVADAGGSSDQFLRTEAAAGEGIEADGLFDGRHKARLLCRTFRRPG